MPDKELLILALICKEGFDAAERTGTEEDFVGWL